MKKLIYSALALAAIFTVSCNKEIESPETAAPSFEEITKHIETLRADFGDGLTRTNYRGKVFSWVQNDSIYVQVESDPDETGSYNFGFVKFYAQSDGASVEFQGEVPDGYHASSPAFYIAINADFDLGKNDEGLFDGNYFIQIPGFTTVNGDADAGYYAVDSSKPLGNMPLVGVKQDNGTYRFTSMTGALKVELTNLDTEAEILEIYNGENKLSGEFALDADLTLKMDNAREGSYTLNETTYNYSNYYAAVRFEQSRKKATVYIPMPVGTLPAGSKLVVMDANLNSLYEKTFKKDVSIVRNTVTELASVKAVHEWTSLGTGKFIDEFTWYNLFKDQNSTLVDVTVQQDVEDPTSFRIVKPYQTGASKFNYKSTSTDYSSASLVLKVEEGGHVTYPDMYYTGLKRSYTYDGQSYNSEHTLLYPTYGDQSYDDTGCTVVKFAADGKPESIQLTACYYWPDPGVWTGDSYLEDNMIRIIFPGGADFDISATIFASTMADTDPAHAQASGYIDFSEHFASAHVVLATSDEEAEAALADPSKYTEVTETGTTVLLDLPANAPSGTYYIYAHMIPAEGYAASLERTVVGDEIAFDNPFEDRGIEIEQVVGYYTTGDDIVAYYDFDQGGYYLYEDGPLVLKVEESDNPLQGEVMMTQIFYEGECEIPVYGYFDPASGHLEFTEWQPSYENIQVFSDSEDYFDVYFVTDAWDVRYNDNESLSIIQPSFPYKIYALPTGTTDTENGYYMDVFAGVNPKTYALRNLTFYKTDEPVEAGAPAKVMGTSGRKQHRMHGASEKPLGNSIEIGTPVRPASYSRYSIPLKPLWNRL